MSPELRAITEETYPDWIGCLAVTFGFDYNPEEDTLKPNLELDRTFGHFDEDRCVSTISAFSLDLTVPGNVIACCGTTVISVAPTHRRRGLLREMMERHFADARDRKEAVAALWASESEIYGRFGYGMASKSATIKVERPYQQLSRLAPEPDAVRLIDLEEAKTLVPDFHDRFRLTQTGMFKRTPAWWESRVFNDLPSRRRGHTEARWVVVDAPYGIDGYAKYRIKSGWGEDGHSDGELSVTDLFANSPEAWAGLWIYLLNHDLINRISAQLRSPYDPLFDVLAGPRRAQSKVSDGVWVRILDVADALSSRQYADDFVGVFEVVDPMEITSGRFLLEVSDGEGRCAPTDRAPDITLDVEDLGSSYLGLASFGRLSRAGRVVGTSSTIQAADAAFRWDPPPWGPEIF